MRKVKCIELNKIYDSLSQASKDLNLSHGNISRCCTGSLKTVGGYHFEYVDNASDDITKQVDNDCNISSEIDVLREENNLLKRQVKDLQAEIAKLKSDNVEDETDKFEKLKKKYSELVADEGYKEESYSANDTIEKIITEQQAEYLQQEESFFPTRWENIPPEISSFNAEKYTNEIESCNDERRLSEIISACNDVLRKCFLYREQNEFADISRLKIVEYDAREVRTKAMNKKDLLENPLKPEPKQIPFQWNEAEIYTNNMMLNEICRYDELMCESAIEAHEKDLHYYNEELEKGTAKESEYKSRKEFEERYLSKLKEHYQDLINKRIEHNKNYESEFFGFAQFAELKKNLEESLYTVNTMIISNDNDARIVKKNIESHKKRIEKDMRELNDSITPDGIAYNKYSLSMRYQIVDIAESKLKAFENNDVYKQVINKGELKAIESLNAMTNNLSSYDVDELKNIKEKLLNKIKCKNEKENRCFVSSLCIAYRLIEDELQTRY